MGYKGLVNEMLGGDWDEVMSCAGVETGSIDFNEPPKPARVEGATCDESVFGYDDIDEILGMSDGENDGPPWLLVLKLKDGRFAYIEAGCNYTGWDCQAGGTAHVADTLEQLIRFGLTEEARDRLGYA